MPQRRTLVTSTALLALLAACSGNPAPSEHAGDASPDEAPAGALDDTLQIPLGEERTADAGRIGVRFVAVVNDSRCPANAVCVWEGDASVRLQVRAAGTVRDTIVHMRLEPVSLKLGQYVVTLPGLLPYPGTYPDDRPAPSPTAIVAIARP